ncbi:MAG: CoA-binding protein [Methanomassiliicoccales archaeon]|nr:CoA-binding protein [Methanomassiliicoccales archaeon]
MHLDLLFNPKSVAIVGASDHPGKIGNTVVFNLLQGSPRKLYPVNPNEEEVLGLKCYPSIKSLPEVVDLAVLAVPAKLTIGVAKECADAGVPYVICIAAGFGEIGEEGKAMEERLREAVRGSGTRLIGPNTMGIIAPRSGLDTFFTPRDRSPRPGDGVISVISQSGSVLCGVYEGAEDTGVGLSTAIGLGNKVDLNENDFMEYFKGDDLTKCIVLYLESFTDGRRFLDLCKEVTPEKPVVAIKVGRTERGAKAASSHTGALARGSDALINGVFKQFGIERAYDEQELLDYSKALAYLGHIDGDRIAVLSNTGGFAVIATDYIESKDNGVGLRMATISDHAKKEIMSRTQYFASAQNPVDLTGSVTDETYGEALEILQKEKEIDAILILLQLQAPQLSEGLADIVARIVNEGGKPAIVCAIGGSFPRPMLRKFEKKGIPAYGSLKRAIWSLRALYDRGMYLKRVGARGE